MNYTGKKTNFSYPSEIEVEVSDNKNGFPVGVYREIFYIHNMLQNYRHGVKYYASESLTHILSVRVQVCNKYYILQTSDAQKY